MTIPRTEIEVRSHIENNTIPEPNTGCVLWEKTSDKDGYGKVHYNKKHWRVHRLVYTLEKGSIPKGRLVQHKCDTPSCCNPEHLFLGTPLSNMQDKVCKGRLKNQHMNKTECKYGHSLELPNSYTTKINKIGSTVRVCVICYENYKARKRKF